MPDRKDLPFLLSLLEDDSYEVRNQVLSALTSFGKDLPALVRPLMPSLEAESLEILEALISPLREQEVEEGWLDWLDIVNPKQSLEYAFIQLAYLEYGSDAYLLGEDLDELAERFQLQFPNGKAAELMEFLFQKENFRSPLEGTESHLHSNLLFVLRTRRGSQIALSCLAILVGWRANLDLEGVMIQGNFMAMTYEDQKMLMFNSYNKGKPLARASVMYIEEAFRRNQISPQEMPAKPHEIIIQILKMAIDIHHRRREKDAARNYVERYQTLLAEVKDRNLNE
ncbi:MAG: transglutaminase family protein [Bacteroidota bacterium]